MMDVATLYNLNSSNIDARVNSRVSAVSDQGEERNLFSTMLGSAIDTINTTNGYLSDAENEEIKLALGETDNVHDLTIALSKASTALQYTVAIRDRLLDAYKEIMQINI